MCIEVYNMKNFGLAEMPKVAVTHLAFYIFQKLNVKFGSSAVVISK